MPHTSSGVTMGLPQFYLLSLVLMLHKGVAPVVAVDFEEVRHLRLTVTPARVDRHTSQNMTLRCERKPNLDTDLNQIFRMEIAKMSENGVWTAVAEQRVAEYSPRVVGDVTAVANITGNSNVFLEVFWDKIGDGNFGDFWCYIIGDDGNLNIVVEKSNKISIMEPENQDAVVLLEERVESVEKKLNQSEHNLEQTKNNLVETENKLEETKVKLEQTQNKTEQVESKLEEIHNETVQIGNKLEQTDRKLEQNDNKTVQIESKLDEAELKLEQTANKLEQNDNKTIQMESKLRDSEVKVEQTASKLEQNENKTEQIERKLAQAENKLQETELKLEQTVRKLEQTQNNTEQVESKLEETESKLDVTELKLEQTESKLEKNKNKTEQIEFKLEQTESKLEQTGSKLALYENRTDQIQIKLQQTEIKAQQNDRLLSIILSFLGGLMEWPRGFYALLRPSTGCPVDLALYGGTHTFLKLHTEGGDDHSSALSHVTAFTSGSKSFVTMEFCEVTTEYNTASWPQGSFCVHKLWHKLCPEGFTPGYVPIDTQNIDPAGEGRTNVADRVGYDPTLQFCCQHTGSTSIPIILPRKKPFLLYRYGGTCQAVQGMRVSEEYLQIDSEDTHNNGDVIDVHPDIDRPGSFIKFHLCYYNIL